MRRLDVAVRPHGSQRPRARLRTVRPGLPADLRGGRRHHPQRGRRRHGRAVHRPDQYELMRADPGVLESGVEEILRWAAPIVYFRRTAREDMVLRDQPIKAGEKVACFFVAANRDPSIYPYPLRFDVRRAPSNHMAFGFGLTSAWARTWPGWSCAPCSARWCAAYPTCSRPRRPSGPARTLGLPRSWWDRTRCRSASPRPRPSASPPRAPRSGDGARGEGPRPSTRMRRTPSGVRSASGPPHSAGPALRYRVRRLGTCRSRAPSASGDPAAMLSRPGRTDGSCKRCRAIRSARH